MWLRYLVGISLFLVSQTSLGWAEAVRVGPVYSGEPGMISVVIELPPGVSPAAPDFHLVIDNNPVGPAQQIRLFRDSGQGMALAVCIDVSGTMARGPLDEAKKALLAFLQGVRPEDRVALISFADQEKIESSFRDTGAHHTAAVQNLRTRGTKTRLYQTIYRALAIFEVFEDPTLPKRRRIVVISDGKDEGSPEGAAGVIDQANKLGIPIDAVGRGRIEEQYAEALRGLSNSTGGYFEHARRDMRTATAALAAIYEKLSRSLVVDFQYEADDSGRTARNAWIELQRHDQPSWKVALPEAISQVTVPPPQETKVLAQETKIQPQETKILAQETEILAQETKIQPQETKIPEAMIPIWVWPIFAALLAAVLVGWGVRRAKGTKEPVQEAPITPMPSVDFGHQSIPAAAGFVEPPRMTQVGGYHFPIPGGGEPTAVLLGVSGPVQGQQFSIDKEIVHIGAQPGNDLLIVGDEYLSGNHAYFLYKQGSLFLFDKGSTNGTFVNRQQITAAGCALSLGDHIQLGTSVFELARGGS